MTLTTWRQLLKKYRRPFFNWLDRTRLFQKFLRRTSTHLIEFLIDRIDGLSSEVPDAASEFWNRIPDVRAACSDPGTFEQPLATEAYAYVHFLERYRRIWDTLLHLTRAFVLPLGRNGIRVLDIGTGPAPALYAIDDFYRALYAFAEDVGVEELQLPQPQLACVESSQSMIQFFSAFSEFSERRGPFGTIATDFSGLNLASRREAYRRQKEYETYWDEGTQEYEEIYDPVTASVEAERLFRFRLVVLSNFLTLEEHLDRFEGDLRALFDDLRPGGVAIVLGGTGDHLLSTLGN